jgi:NAD(P)-dependent dehydrogenase (short-subunit alcohol dehydrogenase family)
MMTISGKTIYVTGGTRGIGLAAARALAARGAHVLLLSRAPDADALAEVVGVMRTPMTDATARTKST